MRTWRRAHSSPRCSWSTWSRSLPAGRRSSGSSRTTPGCWRSCPATSTRRSCAAYVGNATHRGLPAGELDALVEPWTGGEGQPAFYRQIEDYDVALLEENERRLTELDLPVRILWGTEDTWIPLETGRRFAALVPGAVLSEVAGAGHLVQYDAPVPLATALRDWLDPTA